MRDEVRSEDYGGEIAGEETVEYPAYRVVVMGCKGIGCADGMVVGFVEITDCVGRVGMEEEAMDIIL